jgi:hypothetical protein
MAKKRPEKALEVGDILYHRFVEDHCKVMSRVEIERCTLTQAVSRDPKNPYGKGRKYKRWVPVSGMVTEIPASDIFRHEVFRQTPELDREFEAYELARKFAVMRGEFARMSLTTLRRLQDLIQIDDVDRQKRPDMNAWNR